MSDIFDDLPKGEGESSQLLVTYTGGLRGGRGGRTPPPPQKIKNGLYAGIK